jgi:hypothetical protein
MVAALRNEAGAAVLLRTGMAEFLYLIKEDQTKGDLGQPRLAILCGFQFIGARSSDTGRYNLQRWCSLRRFWCGG